MQHEAAQANHRFDLRAQQTPPHASQIITAAIPRCTNRHQMLICCKAAVNPHTVDRCSQSDQTICRRLGKPPRYRMTLLPVQPRLPCQRVQFWLVSGFAAVVPAAFPLYKSDVARDRADRCNRMRGMNGRLPYKPGCYIAAT